MEAIYITISRESSGFRPDGVWNDQGHEDFFLSSLSILLHRTVKKNPVNADNYSYILRP